MDEVYLDYNGSSPLDPRVVEVMLPTLVNQVGNASSVHRFGLRQAALVRRAREQVAALVGAAPSGVVFCSGATEANNLALLGLVEEASSRRNRIVVSAVEHASVQKPAQWLFKQGTVQLDVAGVTRGGFIDLDEFDALLGPDVLVVSTMAANSETGVLNPVAEMAERAHQIGALLHCDATQIVGRLPFSLESCGADLVSLSSHKICGPTGVGALVGTHHALRRLHPIAHGGGHEEGLRSGSLNVAGIVGLGEAAALATQHRDSEATRVGQLRDRMVAGLKANISEVSENGDTTRRLPNTANIRFAGADAEAVVFNMDPVAVSAGSACHAGAIEPSPVLLAMGLSRDEAFESVRFSLGRFTTEADIETALAQAKTAVVYVRDMAEGGEQ